MSNNNQNDIDTLGFASIAEGLKANFRHVEEIMANFSKSQSNLEMDPLNLSEVYSKWLQAMQQDPQKLFQTNMDIMEKSFQVSQQFISGLNGQAEESIPKEQKRDFRFKHDQWNEDPFFSAIKHGYLMTSEWLRNLVTEVEGLDPKTADKVRFYTERFIDSMSPTNFAMTNPAVIEKTIETNGANLVHGLKNMIDDLEEGGGQLRIRMTDMDAFTLGENVAVTPGKVIFQNRMFQLIQYTATTEKVLKRPLLIVPPWINKFYIMDLQPKNSLLKWLVDQGHTVFVISWVNPDEKYAEVGFDEYVKEGVLTAVDVIEQVTGENEMNSIGYCLGGTLLTTTLAYMTSKGDDRIQSATCFTTMLDFSEPGDLGVFIDEAQIQKVEERMAENGYLDGRAMSGVFNLLRANDLIWSFYVNNYLLGNDPRPFDLLYWNSDSTRMPEKMHSWYLRKMYLDNKLREPGGITIDDVSIDLSSIKTPVCFVSAIEDHIAPWSSTYSGAKIFTGDVRFILGNSGHIAGIINPPAANKYGYRMTDSLPDDEHQWAQEADVIKGSWWPEWNNWVRPLSGNKEVAARVEGGGIYDVIEDAPGTYVKCSSSDKTPVLEETKLKTKKTASASASSSSGTTTRKRTTARKTTRTRTATTKKRVTRKTATTKSTVAKPKKKAVKVQTQSTENKDKSAMEKK